MNDLTPSLLQRVSAAVLRWADEQQRLAEDEQYWQAAQHDPRLMADITCAIGRSQAASAVLPTRRATPDWSMLSPLMARGQASHR